MLRFSLLFAAVLTVCYGQGFDADLAVNEPGMGQFGEDFGGDFGNGGFGEAGQSIGLVDATPRVSNGARLAHPTAVGLYDPMPPAMPQVLTTTGGVLAPTQIRPAPPPAPLRDSKISSRTNLNINNLPPQRTPLRIVLLGLGGVGKSAITIQFVQQYFIHDYDPTIADSYAKQCYVDENMWKLEVLDTAGQDEFAAMREHNVRSGDGFLLVFSLTNRESFEYLKRLYHYIDRVKDRDFFPMIVVGNKCDLSAQRQVSREEAESWAQSVQLPYVECSAKFRQNVDRVFHDLVRLIRQFQIAERQMGLEYISDSANTSGSSGSHKKKKGCIVM